MAAATASTMAAVASMPVLTASAPMSPTTASICAVTMSAGTVWIPVTPSVFCAVMAVMADGAVDAVGGERLEVGLDSGAAARVAAGDCQCGTHTLESAPMNASRTRPRRSGFRGARRGATARCSGPFTARADATARA